MTTAITQQEELFPSLPRGTASAEDRSSYNRWRKDFDRMGGMLPPRAAAMILGVKRQRVYQLMEAKKIRTIVYEDIGTWVSVSDILERKFDPPKVGRPKKS
jgi:hypothetical protein